MQNYPSFSRHLIRNIQDNYDDEVRMFLVSCLRKIDYLKGIKDEILTHIAISMVANQCDRGNYIHSSTDPQSRQYDQQMIIIFKGNLVITHSFDGGPEMVIEYISKGTIMNAHNFLAARPTAYDTKCLTSVTYYYLSIPQLIDISRAYKVLGA